MSMSSATPMGRLWHQSGYSALKFTRLLQAQFPEMTEGRLYRIETGRAKATPAERETIARLLGCATFEIQI